MAEKDNEKDNENNTAQQENTPETPEDGALQYQMRIAKLELNLVGKYYNKHDRQDKVELIATLKEAIAKGE